MYRVGVLSAIRPLEVPARGVAGGGVAGPDGVAGPAAAAAASPRRHAITH